MKLKPYLPLLLVVLVAIAFRFFLLHSLPPALNFDEAGNGIAALDVANGNLKIWWPIGGGKEPLIAYLLQPFFRLFGSTRLALRLYAASMGVAAVLATYFLAVQLSAFSNQRSAVSRQPSAVSEQPSSFRLHPSAFRNHSLFTILSALGLTTAFWHVAYSRIAFRANTALVVEALALGFLWMAFRTGRWRHFLLTGFFTGSLIYTYLIARFVPVAIALFFIVEALIVWRAKQKPLLVQYWRKLVGMVAVAAIVSAPLWLYFSQNPGEFFDRAATVSIFNPTVNQGDFWGALWRVTTTTLGTFLSLTGDPNPLGNIPGKPELNPLLAIFFALGVGFTLLRVLGFRFQVSSSGLESSNPKPGTRNQEPETRNFLFLLIWWPVMLLPAILAPEGAPHHLRLIGTAPGTYIFVALGMVAVSGWAGERVSGWAGGQVGGWDKETRGQGREAVSSPDKETNGGWRPALSLSNGSAVGGLIAWVLLLLVFGFTAWQSYYDYFIRWNSDIDHYMDFDVYAEELATQIVAEKDSDVAYIIPMDLRAAHEARHYSLDFLYQTSTAVNGRRSAVIMPYTYVPVDESTAAKLLTGAVADKTTLKVARWTQDKHKEADAKELVTYLLGTSGAALAGRKVYPVYTIESYELPSAETQFSLPAIETPIDATLDGLIQVRRAAVQRQLTPGRQVAVAVTYAPIAPIDVDYKASLRLISPDGTVVAQKDRVLLHNWHQGTSQWPREEVNEYYLFPSPTDAIPGVYEVRLVVYHPDTLAPLTDNGRVEIALGKVEIKPIPK
ncbi:MAG: hypothetical protein B6243_08525 [Anaerolineaceae bacterium 4572_5.2]|nr:MAG: hypothetical protein B6243_08525 [Anaerolineaceae bacterium 4572_5.2]